MNSIHKQALVLPAHVVGVAAPRPDARDRVTAIQGLLKRIDLEKPCQQLEPHYGTLGGVAVLRPVFGTASMIRIHAFRRYVWMSVRQWFTPIPPGIGYTTMPDVDDPFLEQWLERTHYTNADKERLRKVARRARTRNVPFDRIGANRVARQECQFFRDHGMPVFQESPTINITPGGRQKPTAVPRCLTAKGFVKHEYYPIGDASGRKAARHIQARSDFAKVTFGPWIKLLEVSFYDLRQDHKKVGPPSYAELARLHDRTEEEKMTDYIARPPVAIKHVPVQRRPEVLDRLNEPGAKYYATDHTSFEAHFTPTILSVVEQEYYKWMTSENEQARMVMDCFAHMQSGTNFVDGPWESYSVEGTRLSGEMNTSLGNGFANYMAMRFVADVLSAGCAEVKGHVEGDDGLFQVKGELAFSADKFYSIGFHVKEDWQDCVETASFCGNVYDPRVRTNVTDPIWHLINFGGYDSSRAEGMSLVDQLGLCRAKAMASLAEYHGCPVIGPWARKVLQLTSDIHERLDILFEDYWAWYTLSEERDLTAKVRDWAREPIRDENRELVARVFHLPVDAQLKLEKQINASRSLAFNLDLSLFPAFSRETWDRNLITESGESALRSED